VCAARCVVEGVGGVSRLRAVAGAPCTLQLLCRDADGKDVAATSGETFRASLVGKALLDSGGGSGGSGGGGSSGGAAGRWQSAASAATAAHTAANAPPPEHAAAEAEEVEVEVTELGGGVCAPHFTSRALTLALALAVALALPPTLAISLSLALALTRCLRSASPPRVRDRTSCAPPCTARRPRPTAAVEAAAAAAAAAAAVALMREANR